MPWVKGQSGNPAGRKGKSLTDELRTLLSKKGPDGKRHRDEIAAALVREAKAGNVKAIAYIYDRLDGKPIERVEALIDDVTVREFPSDWSIVEDGEKRQIPAPKNGTNGHHP